jgi:hypothetical protein
MDFENLNDLKTFHIKDETNSELDYLAIASISQLLANQLPKDSSEMAKIIYLVLLSLLAALAVAHPHHHIMGNNMGMQMPNMDKMEMDKMDSMGMMDKMDMKNKQQNEVLFLDIYFLYEFNPNCFR